MKKRVGQIITAVVLLLSDQLTKAWASSQLSGKASIEIIKGFFYLTYAENSGGAWSILQGQTVFFIIVGFVAVAVFIYWYVKSGRILSQISLMLIISGTIGNLIDRCLMVNVRDFLDFYIFGYDFPIFNVADSCLTIGMILMLVDIVLEEKLWLTKK